MSEKLDRGDHHVLKIALAVFPSSTPRAGPGQPRRILTSTSSHARAGPGPLKVPSPQQVRLYHDQFLSDY